MGPGYSQGSFRVEEKVREMSYKKASTSLTDFEDGEGGIQAKGCSSLWKETVLPGAPRGNPALLTSTLTQGGLREPHSSQL